MGLRLHDKGRYAHNLRESTCEWDNQNGGIEDKRGLFCSGCPPRITHECLTKVSARLNSCIYIPADYGVVFRVITYPPFTFCSSSKQVL